MNRVDLFGVIVGLSAVISILFYLIFKFDQCLWFMEPLWYIRIPEIIIGLISVIILGKMIVNQTTGVNYAVA